MNILLEAIRELNRLSEAETYKSTSLAPSNFVYWCAQVPDRNNPEHKIWKNFRKSKDAVLSPEEKEQIKIWQDLTKSRLEAIKNVNYVYGTHGEDEKKINKKLLNALQKNHATWHSMEDVQAPTSRRDINKIESGIYIIRYTAKNQWYVGQSQDIAYRLSQHKKSKAVGVDEMIQEKGAPEFDFAILEIINKENLPEYKTLSAKIKDKDNIPLEELEQLIQKESFAFAQALNEREIYWINELNTFSIDPRDFPHFNLKPGGQATNSVGALNAVEIWAFLECIYEDPENATLQNLSAIYNVQPETLGHIIGNRAAYAQPIIDAFNKEKRLNGWRENFTDIRVLFQNFKSNKNIDDDIAQELMRLRNSGYSADEIKNKIKENPEKFGYSADKVPSDYTIIKFLHRYFSKNLDKKDKRSQTPWTNEEQRLLQQLIDDVAHNLKNGGNASINALKNLLSLSKENTEAGLRAKDLLANHGCADITLNNITSFSKDVANTPLYPIYRKINKLQNGVTGNSDTANKEYSKEDINLINQYLKNAGGDALAAFINFLRASIGDSKKYLHDSAAEKLIKNRIKDATLINSLKDCLQKNDDTNHPERINYRTPLKKSNGAETHIKGLGLFSMFQPKRAEK